MNIDQALPAFIAESADLLRDMEAGLLQCSGGTRDPEVINLIFRSAHTIKGSASLFGLNEVVAFLHVVETALDEVRLDKYSMSEQLITLLLNCKDHTEALIEQVVAGGAALDPMLQQRGAALTDALNGMEFRNGSAAWGISLRFRRDVRKAGIDPLSFTRQLKTLGELTSVKFIDEAPPNLGFEIELRTSADRGRIEAAFESVREDCTLVLTAPRRRADDRVVTVAPVTGHADGGAVAQSVRVDVRKFDALITRIGELIIASAGANLLARRSGNSELAECTTTLSELVEQVREGALQLRMVKIGDTFNRFQRVVRDVSRELGKDIRLVIHGEDTELDKTVVDQITDPLTHLVRNAIDHGIEPAQQRAARGKSAVGTVTLNAYHDAGSIVIEISDDGSGLRREEILAKAIEQGLIEQSRTISDSELLNIVFEPGFSTAANVTKLSGRGVGMDVVKRNIAALRGRVAIKSVEGLGTTITVRLPLTLAIIDGFQVGVGRSTFVLPLDAIDECIEFGADAGHDFTSLRGRVLPFVRLRELFGTREPAARRQSIVVVNHAGRRAGLVVDALLGEFQTVIKPLGKLFSVADFASGSSILGNGEVALILDVPALVQRAAARAHA